MSDKKQTKGMNFGAVQRVAQDLARQTRGKKVNRGEPDGHSGTRSASIPAPPNQQNTTSHDITWNFRNLSFFLSFFFFFIAILYTLHTPKISSPMQSTSYI
jgi:hypothetical protein